MIDTISPIPITIGVSCMAHTLGRVLDNVKPLPKEFRRVIAVQSTLRNILTTAQEGHLKQRANHEGCELLFLNSLGLCKSRNAILDHVQTGVLVISDDDQGYLSDGIIKLAQHVHSRPQTAIVTGIVHTPEGDNRRPYPSQQHRHNWRSQLSVGSIEMMLNMDHPAIKNSRFNENFGLGTSLPASEEMIFIQQVRRRGGHCCFYPIPMAIHSLDSSGEQLTAQRVAARGASIRHMFGLKAIVLVPLYAWRQRHNRKKSRLSLAQFLLTLTTAFLSYPLASRKS